MPFDWERLCRDAGLRVSERAIEIRFAEAERRHVVHIDDAGEFLRVWAIVARPALLRDLDKVDLRAWSRNRVIDLVGFKTDERGRLIGEAWVPTQGLTADEWCLYVRSVARACDHFEYMLTGRDVE